MYQVNWRIILLYNTPYCILQNMLHPSRKILLLLVSGDIEQWFDWRYSPFCKTRGLKIFHLNVCGLQGRMMIIKLKHIWKIRLNMLGKVCRLSSPKDVSHTSSIHSERRIWYVLKMTFICGWISSKLLEIRQIQLKDQNQHEISDKKQSGFVLVWRNIFQK